MNWPGRAERGVERFVTKSVLFGDLFGFLRNPTTHGFTDHAERHASRRVAFPPSLPRVSADPTAAADLSVSRASDRGAFRNVAFLIGPRKNGPKLSDSLVHCLPLRLELRMVWLA